MSVYPAPFDHNRFPVISDAVLPREPKKRSARHAKATTQQGGVLKMPMRTSAVVEAVWLQAAADDKKRSQSFQNYAPENNGKIDTFVHFHFLPGIDPVEIRWKVGGIDDVQKARFELWSDADNTQAIWIKEYSGDEAIGILKGSDGTGSGSLAWDTVTVSGDAKRFPGQCPNVAGAPYQLRLIVSSKATGTVTTAWTYFDILVDSIELHWGPETWIPATVIPNVSPLLASRTTDDEKTLLKRLKGQVLPTDPEVSLIPTTGTVPMRLSSTMAAYADFFEWFGFAKDYAFLRHKARWGDGPRIPVFAKIYLRRMDGTKLDPNAGVVTWDQAGAVLGPTPLLWDWHDRPLADRQADEARLWNEAGNFVLSALAYKLNTGNEPPDCRNCHVDRGGKRGGQARCFPDQTGNDSLPFPVSQCEIRKWAALSIVATSGSNACRTGVLFNPSRMAKDSYRITVLLANQLTDDRSRPVVDVGGKITDLITPRPGMPYQGSVTPFAQTAMLEVIRGVNARYIKKGSYNSIDLNLIKQEYEVSGIDIEWLNQIDPNFTGLWSKNDYDQYLTNAIAMAGTDFSDQQVLNKRYSEDQGKLAIQAKRYQTIHNLVNRNFLNDYDHWFGCPVGQNRPQPSEVCFVFPGRDKLVTEFRDQAIKSYIDKKRNFNSVKSAWKKLRNQSPGVSEAALRTTFYNGLKAKQKLKIDTATRQLYKQAGWKDFDQIVPNLWAAKNYEHGEGPIDLLAEMHQLRIAADPYEGVTFFHYINILQTLDASGNPPPDSAAGDPTGRYYNLGGVAKCDTSFSLGLKSTFFVWDHPTDGRRGRSQKVSIPMMNGDITAVHEFGHNLHLTHPFGGDGPWNRDMHDKNPPERAQAEDAPGPADQCVMNYHHQDVHLCGVCRLRLRGWALFRDPPLEGFSISDPSQPGRDLRKSGLPFLNSFFTDLG